MKNCIHNHANYYEDFTACNNLQNHHLRISKALLLIYFSGIFLATTPSNHLYSNGNKDLLLKCSPLYYSLLYLVQQLSAKIFTT